MLVSILHHWVLKVLRQPNKSAVRLCHLMLTKQQKKTIVYLINMAKTMQCFIYI